MNLKEAREAVGLSREELSIGLGVSVVTITRWEGSPKKAPGWAVGVYVEFDRKRGNKEWLKHLRKMLGQLVSHPEDLSGVSENVFFGALFKRS